MSGFLSSLGGKLAEKWLTMLALPGLLLLGTAWTADMLGQRKWHDFALLSTRINTLANQPAMHSTGVVALVLVAVLVGSAAIGLAAQGLGWAIERTWVVEWRVPPARWLSDRLTAWRARRWRSLQERYRKALVTKYREPETPPDTARLNTARNRIGLAEPGRPTWIGDRMAATQSRIHTAYDLDLGFVWPRLWLVLPDTTRTEVRSTADSLAGSARLIAWGVFYAAIGLWWWPAAPIGVIAALIGWRRGRDSMDVFAHLVEACVDIHARDLAQALGLEAAALTSETGLQITRVVRKNA